MIKKSFLWVLTLWFAPFPAPVLPNIDECPFREGFGSGRQVNNGVSLTKANW